MKPDNKRAKKADASVKAKPAAKAKLKQAPVKSPKTKAASPKAVKTATASIKARIPVQPPVKPKSSKTKRIAPPNALKELGKTAPRKAFSVPPVLLEGDLPPAPQASGPGARYALTPETLISQVAGSGGELPESYGTKNLFLAARDPHWLYASWDLTHAQQQEYNSRSRDGHLILRVFASNETTPATPELHMHPESRSWFVHVPNAETSYHAELGFTDARNKWVSVAVSRSTFTPPDAPSKQLAADFATIPPDVTFQQIVEVVQEFASENQPLMEAVLKAREAAVDLPKLEEVSKEVEPPPNAPPSRPPKREEPSASTPPPKNAASATPVKPSKTYRVELPVRIERREDWTQGQAQAVARLISIDASRRVWMGSLEITELIRRQLKEETSSIAAADMARAGEQLPGGVGAPSSAFGGAAPGRGRAFWFKVNAELIVYGATEPDAKVTIAGRAIKLRPDGSFSFRFSLPDGRYQLPAIAISRDAEEGRAARLEFSRSTEYQGHVGAHPQDAALRPPRPENVA